MTAFVALLRAVNVGKRKLVMTDLKGLAETLKLGCAKTFIASGNLLFTSDRSEPALRAMLEDAIGAHMGVDVPVMIRNAEEMERVAEANPFGDFPGSKVAAIFLGAAPPGDAIQCAAGLHDEKLALGKREIYVAYPSGMSHSKLRLPAASNGTARNMNTVAKLATMLREME